MDARPIGVFDSGLGGLTTVKRLTELLPGEDIIYLGDTGRVPYGPRSRETIIKYSRQDAAFLAGFDIKAMVIACNTVCSVAYDVLARAYDIPVYEVVSTPARAAAAVTKNGKIGVIGTTATIHSGAYEEALRKEARARPYDSQASQEARTSLPEKPEITVYSAPCPLFVPLAENGRTGENDVAALAIAEDYLKGLSGAGIDTLILGCTHYPLLRDVISKVVGPDVTLIDSGAEAARLVAEDLQGKGMLTGGTGGTIRYFVTDGVDGFSDLASRFLEAEVRGKVEQITLE